MAICLEKSSITSPALTFVVPFVYVQNDVIDFSSFPSPTDPTELASSYRSRHSSPGVRKIGARGSPSPVPFCRFLRQLRSVFCIALQRHICPRGPRSPPVAELAFCLSSSDFRRRFLSLSLSTSSLHPPPLVLFLTSRLRSIAEAAKMLLRSASTGVLTSLVSVGSANVESVVDLHADHFSPVAKTSVPSTPTHALSSAQHNADDARSVEGGDWDFDSGANVPWPRFRKVQSESDLQSLCRASSNSSSCFAAAESLLTAAPEAEVAVEAHTGIRKSWGRRTKTGLRRGCSLTVIPSSRHMELDESIAELAESLTPLSTMADSDEFEESPRSVNPSNNSRRRSMDQYPQKLHEREVEAVAAPKYSPISKSRFESTWEDVYDENDYVVSSLSAEFASFSGRNEREMQAGLAAASMSVALEASKVGVMFGSQRGSSAAQQSCGPMYVTDLGFGNGGSGGAHRVSGGGSEGGAGDTNAAEAHYRKMLEADPGNALLLRNYAKFLHEVLKDPHRAEVYYERAILANPSDGEVLGAYAKLIWDVYKDEDRAGRYFDQALEANPDDCYLNAAYAAFLWSSEDGPEEEESPSDSSYSDSYINHPAVYGYVAAASA
ncbi:hypothetical protein Mapa_011439 [Marchantia paleacea]|nr:hypothetical protein Mapa_011439 [Marchantia paleacea]